MSPYRSPQHLSPIRCKTFKNTIINQKKLHLSFCKTCTNRKLSLKDGFICGLTDQIADFNYHCPTYECDNKELENMKNQFYKDIQKEYPNSGLSGVLSEMVFKKADKVPFKKFKNRDRVYGLNIKKDNKYDKSIIGMIWFLISLLVWGNLKNDFSWDLTSMNVKAMLILFIAQFYFIYKGFFHNYPALIIINKDGIDYKGDFIFWTDILDYGLLKGKGKRTSEKYVIIGTISSGIKKINLTNMNISQLQFIEILQHHKNVLQQNLL